MRESLYNTEAEKSIIGELIRNGHDTPYILANLKPEYFYDDKHAILFRVMLEMAQEGKSVDMVSLAEKLEATNQLQKVGGASFLMTAVNANLETFGAKSHANIVRELFIKRKTWEVLAQNAHRIQETKKDEKIENIIGETFAEVVKITSSNVHEKTSIQDIINDFTDLQNEYVKLKSEGQQLLGIPTGYKALDRAIDGYRSEHLWTLAAYTSVGKTSFLVNMIKHLLDKNKRVVMFSLEMSKIDLLAKLIAIRAQISPLATIKNASDEEISQKSMEAMGDLHSKRLTIYSEVDDIDEITLLMQFETLKEPVDVFFIDYLQNISAANAKDEYHLITNAVKKLQIVTRRLKTTTVLVSQVSNETKRASGTLDVDGKGSGAIKAASNFFMYLKRDGLEDEIAKYFETGADIPLKCIINKNRHGKIGAFDLKLKQTTGEIYEG
jgi:replicative DNA helicase